MKPLQLIRVLFLLTVFAFATATAGTADAAPQLMVRAHLEPSGPVVAGTQIKLVVDCLTTTWFTEAPDWPLFTVPGAIVSFPEEEAQNLHEVIDGVDWFGVSRAYRIVPQTAQTFDVPSFAITVQPGQMNGPAKVMTPALKFVATVPAGAEGMNPFFPSQKLVASQRVEPSPQHLRVGDEVTRTVTQRAAGTQSMLIPPVNFGEVTGLKRYPKPSATKDIVEDRAGLVAGERTDTVTYVIDHGGKFQLPPVTIEWWNTASQKKEAIVLPAVTISAIAAAEKPLFEIPVDALSRGAAHRIIVVDRIQVLMVCALLLAVFALVWAYPRGVAVGAVRGAPWRMRGNGTPRVPRQRGARCDARCREAQYSASFPRCTGGWTGARILIIPREWMRLIQSRPRASSHYVMRSGGTTATLTLRIHPRCEPAPPKRRSGAQRKPRAGSAMKSPCFRRSIPIETTRLAGA